MWPELYHRVRLPFVSRQVTGLARADQVDDVLSCQYCSQLLCHKRTALRLNTSCMLCVQ